MEFDHFLRDGPPPRHQLESDSDDSDVEAASHAASSRASTLGQVPLVQSVLRSGNLEDFQKCPLILLEGEAAESYLQALLPSGAASSADAPAVPTLELTLDGVTQALIILLDELPSKLLIAMCTPSKALRNSPRAAAALSRRIFQETLPTSVILLSSYNAGTYIENAEHEDDSSYTGATLRYLVQPNNGETFSPVLERIRKLPVARPFDVPNVLTGVPGSIVSQAVMHGAESRADVLVLLTPYLTLQPHASFYQQQGEVEGADDVGSQAPTLAPPIMPLPQAKSISTVLGSHAHSIVSRAPMLWHAARHSRKQDSGPSTAEVPRPRKGRLAGDGNMYL
ncbi:hypothetical protein K437DRAFT_295772 [Tilletiaria anomala UBC 951]|uniref:Uncharacterized protein n=1 Tax=Tilletiaria anomala (strain ATCC 24038 / CBS 436.72 / UBC 951) TaxID=1037660 RepID=A0A066VH39_TILAU|nr:uncharacterized protein K437DRAFT_295772 [Tilletiaria anomala UBC 951]KDN40791.1 hypothetical protein K437DRAFT_295772 [Tilletiaria anomala UBC 951]